MKKLTKKEVMISILMHKLETLTISQYEREQLTKLLGERYTMPKYESDKGQNSDETWGGKYAK